MVCKRNFKTKVKIENLKVTASGEQAVFVVLFFTQPLNSVLSFALTSGGRGLNLKCNCGRATYMHIYVEGNHVCHQREARH